MSRWSVVAAIVLVGSALGGCGSTDEKDQPEAVESAASVVPSDLEEATSADADLDGEADAASAVTADELCGFLEQESPKVVDLQPAEYAAATFGTALFGFYTDHGQLTDIDGADMDSLAAEGCPDTAAGMLPALGARSFEELLSQT